MSLTAIGGNRPKAYSMIIVVKCNVIYRIIIILVALFNASHAMSSEGDFWEWFESNQTKVEAYKVGDEQILNEIMASLHKYNSSLYFEFSTNSEPKEFIITAEGDPQQFDSVMKLVSSAPNIEGWKFIAFKPAHGFDFITNYEGVNYDPKKLWFLPLVSKKVPNTIGLRIGIPSYDEDLHQYAKSAMYIVLDGGIGEKNVIEHIHYLETGLLPEDPEGEGYIELENLNQYIEYINEK